ncbi:alpha-amylase family glycosyl hydrolase [Ferdinandcohnia quinoae]|uniref:Alpha-amylase n=1 Tax=Fredinandcohnia quinoae TaxID=2918902 RepID=A0AAW5EAH9_9BACI|nr:alpha-amylase family glycosyl hydrolase [Fredinandcohnia sp. SECRCQ15]MCH1626148.1 alpha-amylase family glycosyl hydrolase [Fredinandcohnia sp. SECRCQ15]
MKRTLSFMLILTFILSFIPVQAEDNEERTWQDEMIYFIMVDRFHNGDKSNDYEVDVNDPKAYHGGDFKGITKKLDYIKDMGFTAIWLTPIVKNEPKGYHGYWTEDFYDVEEHFGTLEEFKSLVEEAHKREIKVILDLVVNHTGYQHPWLTDPEKKDWFHERKGILNWDNQEDVENGELAGLPDLAQENPEVKKYLLDMAKWWITETDVDGYRLDTVKHVPKWFWKEFSKEVKSVKDDFFLIGEVWHEDPKYVADYGNTGIDSFVDYPFFNEAARIFSRPDQSMGRLQAVWKRNTTLYGNANILGNFIDNHDNVRFTRLAKERDQDPVKRIKLALSYMYTAPGIPIIYYGTEIALDGGEDPDNRRDMEFGTTNEVVTYLSRLSELRKQYPALRKGDFEVLYDRLGMTVFKRVYEDEVTIIAINNSTKSQEVELSTEQIMSDHQLRGVLDEEVIESSKDGYKLTVESETAEVYVLEEKEETSRMYMIPVVIVPLLFIIFFFIFRKRVNNRR